MTQIADYPPILFFNGNPNDKKTVYGEPIDVYRKQYLGTSQPQYSRI